MADNNYSYIYSRKEFDKMERHYVTISDFFLQQRQKEVVKQGFFRNEDMYWIGYLLTYWYFVDDKTSFVMLTNS